MSGLPCPKSQQVSPVDERRYATRMEPHLARWQDRERQTAELVGGIHERVHFYARARRAALERPYVARLLKCDRYGLVTKCGCKGKRDTRWFSCRQHLTCPRCLRSRSRQLQQRVRAGLEAAFAASGPGSKLVLLTLTTRHSGDVAEDRDAIAAGWRALYRKLHKVGWGKFPYVGVWEVTPGHDGKGHVHAHVAVIWPFRDWSVVRRLWLASCPTSERITFVASRRDGRESTPQSVANYLGKYLSKGVQTHEFSPELRADVAAASYQARWVFSSVRFWQPWVPVCPGCGLPRVRAQYAWRGDPCRPVDHDREPSGGQLAWPFPTAHQRAGPGCA